MNRLDRLQCFLFDRLLMIQSDDLIAYYGDEMRLVFRDELEHARQRGAEETFRVWSEVLREIFVLCAPRALARAQLLLSATLIASVITMGTVFGFCTIGEPSIVHACIQQPSISQGSSTLQKPGRLVQLSNGQHMFLECSGNENAVPTVILVTGRGLGAANAWGKVQEKVSPQIRVCSYDAIGVGQSDHPENDAHPERRPIDAVISDDHALFAVAQLKKPYVLVGASDGGILVRRYQQAYPHEIAGLVFVDSAHEEQEWRIAAISNELDPNWNNPAFLQQNGYLPNHETLTWHADIPLSVLERTQKAPASAFPTLNPQQLTALNDEWHNHQVDLAKRSEHGRLIAVPDSGHFMHQQNPDAVADAIEKVVDDVRAQRR
ncbi:alpha/beta fold hydrolase [Terriglobus sp. TAA 43]|uniref:alpha/beta fold hydrolase n=1 Tax=Terriglobus sp. TAA 43 TaxID=278961 RepID=UPI000647BDA8|nr:alpha/beta fold hydrolase [Terriglobus sp. TAA 43]